MSELEQPALATTRVGLRTERGLRAVTDAEEGHDVKALPAGIYGFTSAPAAPELPLYAKPTFRCTEVQKDAKGIVSLLGYVKSEEGATIGAGADPIVVDLYPEPYQESHTLVTIPLSRIGQRRPPTRDNGNPMRIDVGPKA